MSGILYLCRMKRYILLLLWFVAMGAVGGNRIYSPRFKSLTSTVNGDWLNRPIMTLGTTDRLYIDFDEMSHNFPRLIYRLEHCEPDWKTSEDIFESDWLEGFNNNPIEEYQNSINTTVMYTHYSLKIPNERCRLKMSGNYRLTVFDEDADMERVLEVEFYVLNAQMDVGLAVTSNTDIDHNDSHQQVSMTLNYGSQRVTNREEEIQTVVMKNWREDDARWNVRPNFINNRGLTWEHNSGYIFDAGNEYHKFEVLDVSHPTMGLDRITWDGEHYQAYPFATTIRKNYLTDVDANGAFCIRNSNNTEVNYTCDYVWVNFLLTAPYYGDIYIQGQWTTDADREEYHMEYDEAQHAYHTSIMLKQGYYNYQYIMKDGSIPPSEGSFFQTENCYQALVYYKGIGERTWQLVGYRGVRFKS